MRTSTRTNALSVATVAGVLWLLPFAVNAQTSTESDRTRVGTVDQETPSDLPDSDDKKGDMLRSMGPYTPRELYPALMQLPDLSPEQRAEIKRLAQERMEDGLQVLTESRAALTSATENNDLSTMEQAAADMRAGVARYESGLAAMRALENGE